MPGFITAREEQAFPPRPKLSIVHSQFPSEVIPTSRNLAMKAARVQKDMTQKDLAAAV